jgi:SRSO17 transposase
LVLDDTGLPKQGRGSVGVARQYSGTLGKVANCQGVVSAHDVADEPPSPAPIHWPVTAQRYLSAAWATDGARRAKAHIPTAVPFHTQPELARALVERARAWGVPFAWGVADAGSGDNPTFLQGLEARQLAYVVGVSSPFGGRLHRHLALVLLAYSFLACQRWTPADPAGFSPLRRPAVLPGDPSPGARVALPGCRVMAHGNQPNYPVPPQADLTK